MPIHVESLGLTQDFVPTGKLLNFEHAATEGRYAVNKRPCDRTQD